MAVGEEANADRPPVPASRGHAPMTLPSAVAGPRTEPPTPPEPCLLILASLWIVMAIVALPVLAPAGAPANAVPTASNINPNLAPWWELTALPRIGQGVAREIVRYRESAGGDAASVFAAVSDLARVRGIGPKTLQRIGPYLHFDRYHRNGD